MISVSRNGNSRLPGMVPIPCPQLRSAGREGLERAGVPPAPFRHCVQKVDLAGALHPGRLSLRAACPASDLIHHRESAGASPVAQCQPGGGGRIALRNAPAGVMHDSRAVRFGLGLGAADSERTLVEPAREGVALPGGGVAEDLARRKRSSPPVVRL